MIAMAADLTDLDVSAMPDTYPHPLMFAVHYSAWGVVAAALALLFLSLQLWQWRVIGAQVI
jgi:hypothetical protein